MHNKCLQVYLKVNDWINWEGRKKKPEKEKDQKKEADKHITKNVCPVSIEAYTIQSHRKSSLDYF